MRLHRLAFQAFGPFAAGQEIDFDVLGASGLFLLEGPTGAGKTSILDALTFALYGGLSGRDVVPDRQHSHFADPTVEPFVELEFSVRAIRHRIRRTPEWQRPKKRSTGFTRQAQSVHLQRREGATWRTLSSGKAEVGELVGDLLGLNRDQFTQVVLLPQGEFAQFLRASDDDRRVLLTRIFGTSLYDDITAELTQRRSTAQRAVENAQRRHCDRVSAAAEAAGLAAAEREVLIAATEDEQRARFFEVAESLTRAAEQSRIATDMADAALLDAGVENERAQTAVGLSRRLVAALSALELHQKTEPAHQADARRLAAARQVAGISPLITLLDEQAASAAAQRGRVRSLGLELLPVLDASAASTLEVELKTTAADLGAEADALTPVVVVERGLPDLRDRLTAAEIEHDTAIKQLDQLQDRQQELPELIRAAQQHLKNLREAGGQLINLGERRRLLTERLKAASAVGEHTRRLDHYREQWLSAVDQHQRAVDQHQELFQRRLDGMAAELAGQLTARRACAVCGSRTHPHPAQPTLDAVDPIEVEQALAARKRAEQERDRIDSDRAQLSELIATLRVTAGDQEPTLLTDLLARATADLADATAIAAGLPEAEAGLTEREVEQTRLQAALQKASANAAQSGARLAALAGELSAGEAVMAAAVEAFDSAQDRQTTLRRHARQAGELSAAVGEFAREQRAFDRAVERATTSAEAAGFDDLDAVRAMALPPSALDEVERRVSAWQRALERLHATATAPEFEGIEPSRLTDYTASAVSAAEHWQRARANHQSAHTTASASADTVTRFAERLIEFELSAAAVRAALDSAADVVYLADLARGMDGQRRMNLTTYVLRRWFEKVVEAANLRLGSMSSGRYALVRTDSGARVNERSGLTLRVVDQHTGEERSTTSMSGGETFYTSLALALGLTDVVAAEAGGVEIDTLFIDEGFGSLDAETLDQVMAVIDELRDHGRVVGIVSHVADLKDRIQERVEVFRLRDGSSAVRVVA
ncbi:MAG: ATP-binding cassette family protein [Pseudonocardiales bacterium]|nr:ATP-binding cassette family protein [Pseudonocardiales bacterium]